MALLFLFVTMFLFVFPTIDSKELHSNSSNLFISDCIDAERKMLLSFKDGIEDPLGKLSSWHGKDCCKWSGINCSKKTAHVTKLDLRSSNLTGKLNPDLFGLSYMTYLDLSCNDFENSRIPSSIGSMRKLEYLNLSQAYFSGMVPPHLGNLSHLKYLDLQGSFWGIWVSDLNWISRLPSLKYLNLGSVNLSLAASDWPQVISSVNSLEELHLPFCELHHLPKSASVSNFTSLSVLNLDGNGFNTTLPSWLLNITTLTNLSLQTAGIIGSLDKIPWKHLCNLQHLDLSFNAMGGVINRFLESLSGCSNVSMEELQLWNNNLYGQLPESLGQLKNLRLLDLSYNFITGPVPASVGNLSNLQALSLSENRLNGSIPTTIGNLEELVTLNLLGNYLEGVLSEALFLHSRKLKDLRLSSWNKSVAFHVPPNWVPSFSLSSIWIRNCEMDPKFPPFLKTQRELSTLVLDQVGISGEIPDWFWEVISPQLTQLSLYNNKLSGKLPKVLQFAPNAYSVDLSSNLFEGSLPSSSSVEFFFLKNNSFSGSIPTMIGSQMPTLIGLDLSDNSLTGVIPTSLGKLKNLGFLSLSNNKLTGRIPQWKDLEALSTLDLSNNHFLGRIPESLCSLPLLGELVLNNNSLHGNITALRDCIFLSKLIIGDNHFTGTIPRWIGETMSSLSILILRGNRFTGKIPARLCQLPSLHILDLGYNNLSGEIPACVGNLTGFTKVASYTPGILHSYISYSEETELNVQGRQLGYSSTLDLVNIIDLSENSLEGGIPEGITNLSRMGTLNLSHNQLTGILTDKIGDLTLLETLDLSFNHLSGHIPSSITRLTSLSHLNLSYNNLSGAIPSANQFQTLNDQSIYEGNLLLCGSPLPRDCSTPNNEDHRDKDGDEDDDNDENGLDRIWLFEGLAAGFAAGFWIVCGPLAMKKSWRDKYNLFLDNVTDRIHVKLESCHQLNLRGS